MDLDRGFTEAVQNLQGLQADLEGSQPLDSSPAKRPVFGRSILNERTPSLSLGWKIVLSPVFLYLFLGTGLLFLVYKLEGLAVALGRHSELAGFYELEAREWHACELRVVAAFPLLFPLLAIRATGILAMALISVSARVLSDLATRAWHSLTQAVSDLGRWLVPAV